MFIYNSYIFALKLAFQCASLAHRKAKARVDQLNYPLHFPEKNGKKIVWIHAASAGEFEQILPLAETIKKEFNTSIYVSFFSISGLEIFENQNIADFYFLLPFDTPKNAHVLIDALQPDIVIWAKYDFWFNFLNELKQRQIPLYLANADLRLLQNKPWPYSKVIAASLPLFHSIFTSTIPEKPFKSTRIQLLQDTKWERARKISSTPYIDLKIDNFSRGRKLLIAGSTHHQDLEILAQTVLKTDFSLYAWLIVPHETDEAALQNVVQKFESQSIRLYSETTEKESNILIIDKKGILKYLYRFASVAYVGGGFGQGVHNLLEAAAYEIPVICGPGIEKSNEANTLKTAGILTVVKSESEMKISVSRLISSQQASANKEKASKCFEENLEDSPSQQILQAIKHHLT